MSWINHFPTAAPQNGRRAFTLVELLVVIGIIALLIAILLPALNRARAAAQAVDCSSRMRQMGQAIHMDVSEYNGRLPAGVFNYPADTGGFLE
jgi:prepilin-type N-terminal cleavage/methylation domain-containing protein